MARRNTLERLVLERISSKKSKVLLREDFADLGEYKQIGRILKTLVEKGNLIRIGYGLYAKTQTSVYSGKIIPRAPLPELALQAMKRLGIKTTESSYSKAYNKGESTQVPTGRVIAVKGNISRKISYNGAVITYEKVA